MSRHPATETRALQQLIERMPGRRLPAERDLAQQFGISRTKVRTILARFEAEGLVERHQGSGTYAVDPEASRIASLAILLDKNLKLGDDPFFTLVVEKLQERLQSDGIRAVLERIDAQTRPVVYEDAAVTLGLAGREVVRRWQPGDPPLVGLWINTPIRSGVCASLFQLDNNAAGEEAARRLVARGRRTVLMVGRGAIPDWGDRVAGAARVLALAGASFQSIECGMHYAAGVGLGQQLALPDDEHGVGIIASNDWLAVGLRTGLAAQGRAVLSRVDLISFDGLKIAATVGIESLAVPVERIVDDVVLELRRLRRFPTSCGRVFRYPLGARPEVEPAVANAEELAVEDGR
ncbi:MAG: GntR family transcriptional regulator, partial [Solirubrobacterales bacterium]|nr:GntR family transcriptional regulator [Solirubrobacterales bacterium]